MLRVYWDKNIIFHYNIFLGAYTSAINFILTLLPWKLLMGIWMRRKEKLGAAIAISMGVLAAIVKTVYLLTLYGNDIYNSVQLFIWNTVKVSVTIIATLIPTLHRPLYNALTYLIRHGGIKATRPVINAARHLQERHLADKHVAVCKWVLRSEIRKGVTNGFGSSECRRYLIVHLLKRALVTG